MDAVKNAADEGQVNKAARDVRHDEKLREADLADLLRYKAFRRYVWRWIRDCGVFKLSYTGNAETYFKEGQRNIGLNMLEEIKKADPKVMVEMMLEEGTKEIK
jgi:hypothetical protein